MRAFEFCQSVPWAITPEGLQLILTIANREGSDMMLQHALTRRETRRQAVAAQEGRPLDNTRNVTVRDGVASLSVLGPIVRYADIFSEISGATSIETLSLDFHRALIDPMVRAVLLNIDSPGGELNGIQEFAAIVYASRGVKPIVAYIGDLGASAAYWIASAADEIVCARTALVGSIGVVAAVRDPSKQTARDIEFVSSQSPKKRGDPNTEAGKAEYQRIVDELADVFVASVALHRGVSEETVLADYGQGGVLVGQAAVDAGMVDSLGSYEQVLATLQEQTDPRATLYGAKQPLAPAALTKERSMGAKDTTTTAGTGTNPTPEAPPAQPATTAPGFPLAGTATASQAPSVPAQGAADSEIVQLRAELARLKASRIADNAEHFADAQIAASKAVTAERPAIIAAYTLLASELDERGVTTITALFEQRPAHGLTNEMIPSGQDASGWQLLPNRATTPGQDAETVEAAAKGAREYAARANGHKEGS